MRLSERLSNWFFANPIAWLLLAVLAVAEYGNHHLGRDLTRICELTEPHDVSVSNPRTAREEIDNICLSRPQPEDEDASQP
jgi:hypothetical protein